MKKKTSRTAKAQNGMRAEYDFSSGIRGKHYKSRLRGYVIRIHKPNGIVQLRKVER